LPECRPAERAGHRIHRAVFDYYAGVTQRAPPWVCKLGLEWLYRLPREPRRLWRRTLVSAPQFLWLVVRDRLAR
jgi:N-acetylglucosaminyldiphosphoundecaprenol N-acetyl-beta-D-mannosaminyltransferase